MDVEEKGMKLVYPDLMDGSIRSNIIGATKYATQYFQSHLKSVLSECASRKESECGKILGATSKLSSLVPHIGSALSIVVEHGGKVRRSKAAWKISRRIKFEEGSDQERLITIAKAFAKLNIAFYNVLYPSDHVSEALL